MSGRNNRQFPNWTGEELEILKEKADQGLTWTEISTFLPGRSWASCQKKYVLQFIKHGEPAPISRHDGTATTFRSIIKPRSRLSDSALNTSTWNVPAPAPGTKRLSLPAAKESDLAEVSEDEYEEEQVDRYVPEFTTILGKKRKKPLFTLAQRKAPSKNAFYPPQIESESESESDHAPAPEPEHSHKPKAERVKVSSTAKPKRRSFGSRQQVFQRKWTDEDNQIFVDAVKNGIPWDQVTRLFPDRTPEAVSQHMGIMWRNGALNVAAMVSEGQASNNHEPAQTQTAPKKSENVPSNTNASNSTFKLPALTKRPGNRIHAEDLEAANALEAAQRALVPYNPHANMNTETALAHSSKSRASGRISKPTTKMIEYNTLAAEMNDEDDDEGTTLSEDERQRDQQRAWWRRKMEDVNKKEARQREWNEEQAGFRQLYAEAKIRLNKLQNQ